MNNEITPEERLLKHIRTTGDKKGKAKGFSKGSSGDALQFWGGGLALFGFLNKLFIIMSVVLAVYIVYDLAINRRDVTVVLKQITDSDIRKASDNGQTSRVRQTRSYIRDMQDRDIFESPLYRRDAPVQDATISSAPELTKNLRLVGVMLADVSEAVIEDIGLKQTYFLTVGDEINNATIEEILEGKVILKFGDQRVELSQ